MSANTFCVGKREVVCFALLAERGDMWCSGPKVQTSNPRQPMQKILKSPYVSAGDQIRNPEDGGRSREDGRDDGPGE